VALSPTLFVDRHNVHLPNMYSVNLMISICARIMVDLPDDHPHTQNLCSLYPHLFPAFLGASSDIPFQLLRLWKFSVTSILELLDFTPGNPNLARQSDNTEICLSKAGTGDMKGAMIPTATMMIVMIAPRHHPPKLSHPHRRGPRQAQPQRHPSRPL